MSRTAQSGFYVDGFYSQVGKSIDVAAQVVRIRPFDDEGRPLVYLRAATGHCLVWFAPSKASTAGIRAGDLVVVKGRVTKHRHFDDYWQTHITNCHIRPCEQPVTPSPEGGRPVKNPVTKHHVAIQDAWSAIVSGQPVALKHVAAVLGTNQKRLFEVLREAKLLRKVPSGHETVEGSEHLFKIEPVIYDDVVHLKPLVYLEAMPVVVKAWHEHGDR